jgi:hypothetical protein
MDALIMNEDEIRLRLREEISRRQTYGCAKIAKSLGYSASAIWQMLSPKNTHMVSEEVAEFLGYQKCTLYVKKELYQDPQTFEALRRGTLHTNGE